MYTYVKSMSFTCLAFKYGEDEGTGDEKMPEVLISI
jgi:hypothetical protein